MEFLRSVTCVRLKSLYIADEMLLTIRLSEQNMPLVLSPGILIGRVLTMQTKDSGFSAYLDIFSPSRKNLILMKT